MGSADPRVGPGRVVDADAAEISVVVPYFDNQHDLDLLLAGLTIQTHPRSRLQIIVADDGSQHPPRIPELAAALDISIVRQEDQGFRAGAARNLGVRQADGQVILFLDGDTVPSPAYVQELGRQPAMLPEAVVCGRRRYADLSAWTPAELLSWFHGGGTEPRQWDELDWLTNEYSRTDNLLATHPRSYKYLIGAVLGCSRDLFDEIGGFDETITGYGGEDYDLTYRAYNAGAVLGYVPEAVAWHDGPDWSGRTDPAEQRSQKNREVMMLAERIPEPSMRGQGQTYPVVDAMVTVHTDDWTLGAAVLCVRSILAELDAGVWIEGSSPAADALRACFRHDHRVRSAPLDAVDDRYLIARARLRIDVFLPFTADESFAGTLTRMLETDLGGITVTAPNGSLLDVESSRSLSRRQRSNTSATHSAPDRLARRMLDHRSCGVEVIEDEPMLAAVFGGYG